MAPNPSTILQNLRCHAPDSTHLIGLATLVIYGEILLLSGLTLTAVVLGIIFFTPVLIMSSPVWIPLEFLIFVTVAGFLSFFRFGVATAVTILWVYRYFRGFNPPDSDRFDYARTRIADTAGHVKDYAREYGGYLHSKVKDVTPSV